MSVFRADQSLADRPARLGSNAASQMAREALRTRRSIPQGGDPSPYNWTGKVPYFVGLIPAVVTVAIGPCTSSPGTGQVQLYYWDVDTSSAIPNPDDGASIAVLNWYQNSGTIAIGTHVYVTWWSNALWFAGGDC